MKSNPMHDDRQSRLLISFAVGCIVLALVILVAVLVHDAADDDSDRTSTPGRCAPAVTGTVDPVTCLPYGSSGAAAVPGANDSRSSARKPAQAQPKQPAAKVPAAPKAPAPPAVRR